MQTFFRAVHDPVCAGAIMDALYMLDAKASILIWTTVGWPLTIPSSAHCLTAISTLKLCLPSRLSSTCTNMYTKGMIGPRFASSAMCQAQPSHSSLRGLSSMMRLLITWTPGMSFCTHLAIFQDQLALFVYVIATYSSYIRSFASLQC